MHPHGHEDTSDAAGLLLFPPGDPQGSLARLEDGGTTTTADPPPIPVLLELLSSLQLMGSSESESSSVSMWLPRYMVMPSEADVWWVEALEPEQGALAEEIGLFSFFPRREMVKRRGSLPSRLIKPGRMRRRALMNQLHT